MDNQDTNKVAGTGKRVLASEIASRATDPYFYAALQVLPNPDTVLRKLGSGQEIYDAIEYDAHVMGELRSIRAGLLAWEWRLQAGGDDPRDIAALELCQKVFDRRPDYATRWSDTIWNVSRAVFHGFQVHEVIWERHDGLFIPGRIVDRPQRRFTFDTDKRLRLLTRNNLHPGEELGNYKWLLTRHMMRHDNPYGVAVLSACFWPYTFKHHGFGWFSKFLERYGIPSPVGKYPPGTQQKEIDTMIDALSKLILDRVAAIPEGGSVDLLETKGATHAIHKDYINLCNRELSKALTSQTLATEVQDSGSRAVSETHHEREEAGQESDREMVASTFTELCAWMTELNLPGARHPIFQFYEEAETQKETAETIDRVRKFLPISKTEAYQRLQLRQPEPDEEVIGPGVQQEGGTFSACPRCGETHSYAAGDDRDDLDRLADQADEEATKVFEHMAQPIRDLMAEVVDLEEFRDRLVGLYPKINDEEFAAHLANFNLVARLKGMDES